MPIVDIPLDDPREPGRTCQAAAWCPRIEIDARAETIAITTVVYNSQAAYAADAQSSTRTFLLSGEGYRALVAANLQLWGLIAGLADGAAAAVLGGTVVPATPPAWASEE